MFYNIDYRKGYFRKDRQLTRESRNISTWNRICRGKIIHPGLFFIYLLTFQTNITIFTTNIGEKCPSNIRCWDSNPQPSVHVFKIDLSRPLLFCNFVFPTESHLLWVNVADDWTRTHVHDVQSTVSRPLCPPPLCRFNEMNEDFFSSIMSSSLIASVCTSALLSVGVAVWPDGKIMFSILAPFFQQWNIAQKHILFWQVG